MKPTPKQRLEYLRKELRAERISYGELAELQSLAPHIAPDDVELREAAGLPEFPEPKTKVLFRKDGKEIVAVFPAIAGTNDPYTFTVYAHMGQHSTGSVDWYWKTRKAKPEEYSDLARELRGIGYDMDIRSRMTRADLDARKAQVAR